MKICPDCGMRVDVENHDCPVRRKKRNKQQRDFNKNAKLTERELTSMRWRRFRKDIILKDGSECQRCLIKMHKHNYEDLTVHHIMPRVKYPELMYKEDNCITLCRTCNLAMGLNGIDFDWLPEQRSLDLDPKF